MHITSDHSNKWTNVFESEILEKLSAIKYARKPSEWSRVALF